MMLIVASRVWGRDDVREKERERERERERETEKEKERASLKKQVSECIDCECIEEYHSYFFTRAVSPL